MGRHALELRKEGNYRASWGWFFWSILPVAASALYLLTMGDMPVEIRNGVLGALGAALGACAFIWAGYMFTGNVSKAQTIPPPPPSINGNCNALGNNNSLCNNYGPQKLVFSEALGNLLLERMPIKKPVTLEAIGSPSDWKVGADIQAFLQKNGYSTDLSTIGMQVPPPMHKISLTILPDHYILTVSPSLN